MKICLHTFFEIAEPYIGGTQTFLIKLAKELKVLGHDVFIVCSSLQPQKNIEGVDIYGVIPSKYKKILLDSFNGIASSRFLRETIFSNQDLESAFKELSHYSQEQYSKFQADVYHLNSFISAAFADTDKYSIVVSNHENKYEFDNLWGNNAYDTFAHMVYTKSTRLHLIEALYTASAFYANEFSKHFNLKINYVHLGVLLNDMLYSNKINNDINTAFNRGSETIVILIPSRFNVRQKGQDIAIQACEQLLKKYDIEIVFSGVKQSLFEELMIFRNSIKSLHISNHLHFVAAPNMYELYDSIHIVLSPERYCTYGLSISESLAIGIPTVLSNIPTYKEIALGYDHAFFFERDNLENLIQVISNAIERSKGINYRYNQSAVKFRINNDIRRTAIAFSDIYMNLFQ